jgi:amino acid permease
MRFASFGVLGLILCSILIIGLLADNLINGELLADKKQINLFTENFSSVSENLQFAFFMQSYIIHLVTKHNDLEKNTRALKFGVLFTFLIYALAGVLGALALVGR